MELILSGLIRSLISLLVSLCHSFEMIAMTRFIVGLGGSLCSQKVCSRFIISDERSLSLRFLGFCNLVIQFFEVPMLTSEEAMDSVSDLGSTLSAHVV